MDLTQIWCSILKCYDDLAHSAHMSPPSAFPCIYGPAGETPSHVETQPYGPESHELCVEQHVHSRRGHLRLPSSI